MKETIIAANSETIDTLYKCAYDVLRVYKKYGCNTRSAIKIISKILRNVPFMLMDDTDEAEDRRFFYNGKIITLTEIQKLPQKERDNIVEYFKQEGVW